MVVYSVLVPAFNEAKNIPLLLPKIDLILKKLGQPYEILFINDHSTDNTKQILEDLQISFPSLLSVSCRGPQGPGTALREGFHLAKGEIIITMDGDFSHDPLEIPSLLEGLKSADMVCGSRYVQGGRAELRMSRYIISRMASQLIRILIGLNVQDITSNFRVFRRSVLEAIDCRCSQYGIFIEIPLKAYLKGFKIAERPIFYHKRLHGVSHLSFKQWNSYLKVLSEAIGSRYNLNQHFPHKRASCL